MTQPPKEIVTPIIEAVSEMVEAPVEALPPVTDTIDPDALESLMADYPANDVTVTFAYAGLRVLVHSNGIVYVCPPQTNQTGPKHKISDDNE